MDRFGSFDFEHFQHIWIHRRKYGHAWRIAFPELFNEDPVKTNIISPVVLEYFCLRVSTIIDYPTQGVN